MVSRYDEDTGSALEVANPCERCREPMGSERIGLCSDCAVAVSCRCELVYGGFPGGDPNEFSPDEECCGEDELAAHKAACEAWAKGCRTVHDRAQCTEFTFGNGKGIVCTTGAFGIGAYMDASFCPVHGCPGG